MREDDECCWNCDHYIDSLCEIHDDGDEEDPNLFRCNQYEPEESG